MARKRQDGKEGSKVLTTKLYSEYGVRDARVHLSSQHWGDRWEDGPSFWVGWWGDFLSVKEEENN